MATTDTHGPVHVMFGLSYANYYVAPRTLLQSMPREWQERFAALIDEMETRFAGIPRADCYAVTAVRETTYAELTYPERLRLGVTMNGRAYIDAEGNEHEGSAPVLLPVPDPVPHYDRGRTYVEPADQQGTVA